MRDRIQEKIDGHNRIRRQIAEMKPAEPTDAETAVARVRAQFEPYVERMRSEVAAENTLRLGAEREVERLERNLRVLRATAQQYGQHYPKWELFAAMVERALNGERL